MSEQQPHLEILSRNRVSRSTIIVAVIPTTIFSLVLVYALWQFLWWIAISMLALAALGALYLIAVAAIDVRRRWIHSRYIHLGEHGVVDARAARMYPLALPETVITEASQTEEEPVARVRQALDVLEVHSHGVGIKSIAASYKDSGDAYWTEWRVRQVIEAAKDREGSVRKPRESRENERE